MTPAALLKELASATEETMGSHTDAAGWLLDLAEKARSLKPAPLAINLNSTGIFRLSSRGRDVWRKHCAATRKLLAALPDYKSPYTGEETELRLQFWAFIEIFGAPELWSAAHEPPLSDMNVTFL